MKMTEAQKLYFAGAAHACAAHAIIGAAQLTVHMNVPFYLLVGFSLETVLKAAYVHLGGNIEIAKKKIRHNLPTALQHASEKGFEPENRQVKWLVDSIADVHQNHSFRYLTGKGELAIPDAVHGLRILDDLVCQVGQLLHSDRDYNYWIGHLNRFDADKATQTKNLLLKPGNHLLQLMGD